MNNVILIFGELKLTLDSTSRSIEPPGGPYLEWLNCNLRFEYRSVGGLFACSLMPQELESLSGGLSTLYNNYPNRSEFRFESVESNVDLFFQIGARGQVEVRFEFRDELVNPVVVKGSTEMDQQSLAECASGIRLFIKNTEKSAA